MTYVLVGGEHSSRLQNEKWKPGEKVGERGDVISSPQPPLHNRNQLEV